MKEEDNNHHSLLKQKYGLKIIATEEELSEIEKGESNQNEIIEYKILVIGDNFSGKTSFCRRFALNEFDLEIKKSIETNCFLKTVQLLDKEIKIYLLDIETIPFAPLDKEEEYELYKDSKGIIVIFDLTNYESFNKIEKLINSAKEKGKLGKDIPIILLGNKNDLKFLRNIDFSKAKEKSNSLGYELFEINCNQEEEIVSNVMKNLIAKIYFNDLSEEEKEEIINKAKENFE